MLLQDMKRTTAVHHPGAKLRLRWDQIRAKLGPAPKTRKTQASKKEEEGSVAVPSTREKDAAQQQHNDQDIDDNRKDKENNEDE